MKQISLRGAREHNLKNISLDIPRNKLVVITGLSGSGKSSLAFDTIYAEGQRRYLESLSAYARQFMEQMQKPDMDSLDGLSPSISIEQKNISRNPRSTVGTVTEIYDYLRLLYARLGTAHCYQCGKAIQTQSQQQILDQILKTPPGTKLAILAPIARRKKGEFMNELRAIKQKGFNKVRIDGELIDLYASATPIRLKKSFKHDISVYIDRVLIKPMVKFRLAEAIEAATKLADGLVEIEWMDEKKIALFSTRFACPDCGISLPEIEPRSFSFNNPQGACSTCDGIGSVENFDIHLLVPDPKLSLEQDAILPWKEKTLVWKKRLFKALAEKGVDSTLPFAKLSAESKDLILHGSGKTTLKFEIKGQETLEQNFEGLLPMLDREWDEAEYESELMGLEPYLSAQECAACKGRRLKPELLSITIQNKNISEFCEMSAAQALEWVNTFKFSKNEKMISDPILNEIRARLQFLNRVGLDYLSLSRSAQTLSGGEAQRIRLASQIGSNLVGVLYVLDEPSIGLHQKDNQRLIETLETLRDRGNSVLVVEHDEETMRRADYLIDLGPGAGTHGGELVYSGAPNGILKESKSLTGKYLSGERIIPAPSQRREAKNGQFLFLEGANKNNLQDIDVKIPIGALTCVTGVSGSGKSSLIIDTLLPALEYKLHGVDSGSMGCKSLSGLEHLDKVVHVDQSPIGRTPRSNPSTYTGLFTPIRELFSELPEAKMRGYTLSRFSFNVKGGRCEACSGDGNLKISMNFLPDVYVQCEVCQGKRYNRETLMVRFHGKNISDVLNMTIEEAALFFEKIPTLRDKITTLLEVGLGYIHLGQSAVTLSGGEAQRIKLARELNKRATGRTLYILDEPTTGLHFEDIRRLMQCLHALVALGNTVIVIEHQLDVIRQADYVIDLGPDGGIGGGKLLYQGSPEGLKKIKASYTAKYI